MTDRELLEAAAKAAGIDLWHEDVFTNGLTQKVSDRGVLCWNPLTNDDDALRLAVQLKIEPRQTFDMASALYPAGNANGFAVCNETYSMHNGDPYAATRRAIVRAAAAMAKDAP